MKLLCCLDDYIGHNVFNYLVKNFYDDLGLIVTLAQNDIWENAKQHGIPTMVYTTEEQFITNIKLHKRYDLGLLAAWPKIIPSETISLPIHGFINLHPGYLPHTRGKHAFFWSIVEERPYGGTIHVVAPDIDAGDILFQRKIDCDWTDNGETAYNKTREALIGLFEDCYPQIRTLQWDRKEQRLEEGSFHMAKELEPASRVDLDKLYTGRELLNLLRARTFSGYPGCWFEEDGRVYEARIDIKKR